MGAKINELATIKSADAGLKWLLCVVCGLLSSVSIHAQTNLVLNGGFETGDLTGWTPSSVDDVEVDTDPYNIAHSGNSGAYIASGVGSLAYIFQTVPTIPGRSYLISAWVKGTSNRPFPRINEFHVSWDGTNLFDATNRVFGQTYWDSDWTNVQFVAVASGQHTLLKFGFQDNNAQGGYLGLDDVSVVLVAPPDDRPLAITGAASEVGPSSATVNGTVWPNGGAVAWFEYGTTTNYGSRTAMVPIASNIAPVQVSSPVSGLSWGSVYHWRLVATNDAGAGFGLDSNFRAAPQSLVVNGGFETGNFNGWTQTGQAGERVDTYLEVVHSGAYGAYFGPAGSLGYLSQTLNTIPGGSYLISAWVHSEDGETPYEFNVTWDGTSLFDAYNLPVAWTNVQLVAVASTDHALLQFGFRDDPDYLDFDDVSVVLIPSPEFLPGGLTVTNGNLALTWRSLPGLTYQLQYTTSLPATAWIDLGPSITATDLRTTALDPIGSDSRRFYRVVMLP